MSDSSQYFSPIPLFILFREAIEASIVISVLLTFLKRSSPKLIPQIWWGVGAAAAIAISLGIIFAVIYYKAQQNLMTGGNLLIFKGVVCWVATIFITFLAFAMLRYQGWEAKWARKLGNSNAKKIADANIIEDEEGKAERAAEEGRDSAEVEVCFEKVGSGTRAQGQDADLQPGEHALPPPTTWWGKATASYKKFKEWFAEYGDRYDLFFVVFFTVLREGLEAVVFMFGVGNAQPSAIPISALIGLVCGIMVGVVLYYTGKQVKDIKYLLMAFAAMLFFIAAGAAMNGANWLMSGGMFGTYYWTPSVVLAPSGAITSQYGGGASSAAAAAFNDGDEGPGAGPVVGDDGYVYIKTPAQPWWQKPLWDISGCCGDGDDQNKFLALARAVFGYNSQPCFIDIIFYLGFWWAVLLAGIWKWHKGTLLDADYKYNKMMRKKAAEDARLKSEALALDNAALPVGTKSVDSGTDPTEASSSGKNSREHDRSEVQMGVVAQSAPAVR